MKRPMIAIPLLRYSPKRVVTVRDDASPEVRRIAEERNRAAAEDRDTNSCESQLDLLRTACGRWHYELDESRKSWEELVEGDTPIEKRLPLLEAIAHARPGVVFVAREASRIARGYNLFAILMRICEAGGKVRTIEDGMFDHKDPDKLISWGIKGVMAGVEKINKARATSRGMRRNMARGERMSGIPPIGFAWDPADPTKAIVLEEYRPILRRIADEAAAGKPHNRIATDLTAEGACGRRWNHKAIGRILARIELGGAFAVA